MTARFRVSPIHSLLKWIYVCPDNCKKRIKFMLFSTRSGLQYFKCCCNCRKVTCIFHHSSHLTLGSSCAIAVSNWNLGPRLRPLTANFHSYKKLWKLKVYLHWLTINFSCFGLWSHLLLLPWPNPALCEIQPSGIWCKKQRRVTVVMTVWCWSDTHKAPLTS